MNTDTFAAVLTVAVVVCALVVTGPVGGVDVGPTGDDGLGEGTATVESVALAGSYDLAPGRFGTGVVYLRIPDVAVSFETVTGRSRLVYRVSVPALDFERVGTRAVAGDARRTTVGMSDRAFEYATVSAAEYRVAVTVRVQSFAVDRTVLQRNVTVEGGFDG